MLVRFNYYKRKDNNANLVGVYLMLNDHNIYGLNNESDGYRGVAGSMEIKNLFDKTKDDVRMG